MMWSRTVTEYVIRRPSSRWCGRVPGDDPAAMAAMTAGRSRHDESSVSSASNTGSCSRRSARREPVAPSLRLPRRRGATIPTWLERIVRRREWKSPPSRRLTARSPYQLASMISPSVAAVSRASCSPSPKPLVSHHEVAVAAARRPDARTRRRAARRRPPSQRSTSTSVTSTPGMPRASRATAHPIMPAPTTLTRSPTSGAASHRMFTAVSTAPASTARRAGTPSGTTAIADSGTTNADWCGKRVKTVRPTEIAGTALDHPDVQVPVLDGTGKVAVLERRAHPIPLAGRNLAAEHDRLGAPADAGVKRAHQHLAGLGIPNVLGPERPGAGPSTQKAVARLTDRVLRRMNHPARGERVMSGIHEEKTESHSAEGSSRSALVDRRRRGRPGRDRRLPALGRRMVCRTPLPCRVERPAGQRVAPRGNQRVRLGECGDRGALDARRPRHRAGRDILHHADLGAAADRADQQRSRSTPSTAGSRGGRTPITELGARFDMEVDAFLLLVLSVYVAPELGWWVLSIGLLRYAFVAAGWLLPWMRATLPPRYWRKVVTAVAGIALTIAASGLLPAWAALAVTLVALGLLLESFGRDVIWLFRRRRTFGSRPRRGHFRPRMSPDRQRRRSLTTLAVKRRLGGCCRVAATSVILGMTAPEGRTARGGATRARHTGGNRGHG